MGKEDGIWHLEGAEEESGQTELEAELGKRWDATWSLNRKGLRLWSGKTSRRLTLPARASLGRGSLRAGVEGGGWEGFRGGVVFSLGYTHTDTRCRRSTRRLREGTVKSLVQQLLTRVWQWRRGLPPPLHLPSTLLPHL